MQSVYQGEQSFVLTVYFLDVEDGAVVPGDQCYVTGVYSFVLRCSCAAFARAAALIDTRSFLIPNRQVSYARSYFAIGLRGNKNRDRKLNSGLLPGVKCQSKTDNGVTAALPALLWSEN